ncbi:hypothetical protein GW17_00022795 [Ensete ventricosum]|nr:hypothetical protein GW17_00022795 [Ensete ventricosum]
MRTNPLWIKNRQRLDFEPNPICLRIPARAIRSYPPLPVDSSDSGAATATPPFPNRSFPPLAATPDDDSRRIRPHGNAGGRRCRIRGSRRDAFALKKVSLAGSDEQGRYLFHLRWQSCVTTTNLKAGIAEKKPLGVRPSPIPMDGKDQEMQIGHPTDVKHVAHVGCDGSSNHSPSWGGGSSADASATPLPHPSRRVDTMNNDDSSSDRHSRRHQSSGAVSGDHPRLRDTSEESKHGRKHRSSAGIVGAEQTAPDLPAVPKQPRRRKAKGSSSAAGGSGGTTKSSRSKAVIPSESGSDEQRSEPIASPILKPTMEEEEENEEEGVAGEKKATGALHSFDAASI